MAGEVKNDFSTNTLNEVIAFSDEVHQRMLAKKAEHDLYESKRSIFLTNSLLKIKTKYESALVKYKNDEKNPVLLGLKSEYASSSKTYRDYEIDSEVSLASLQSAERYDQKMSGPASIAREMLG